MSIQPLPPEVIAQIKSSIAITSLNEVICQLVKNSLDASSTRIDVKVDYARGGCVAEDDGLGIQPSEFGDTGGLGKLHHSSKLNSQIPVHGGRGTFLAALSAMALLTITSHHHLHRSHNTISMHKSEVVSRQIPAPAQQYLSHTNHGSRVTVRDLFGNMPVRVKQRAIAAEKQRGSPKEWEDLKRDIVSLLLSWPKQVAITVREVDGQKLAIRPPARSGEAADCRIDVSRVCSVLTQAAFISLDEKTSWVPVGISTSSLKIHGFVSLQPSAVKHIQFISFGVHPLKVTGQSILHDDINKVFVNSSFGNEEELSDLDDAERARRSKDQRFKGEGYTNRELKGRKGVERWPMFYINIDHTDFDVSKQLDPDGSLDDRGGKLSAISDLLQVMITEFLTLHHFRPKNSRGKRTKKPGEDDAPLGSPSLLGKPTTPLNATAPKKSSLKRARSSFDPLGANITLPSFRRSSSKPEPLLDGWSRVKSGVTRISVKEKAQSSDDIQRASSIIRPCSTPIQATPKEHSLIPRANTPLIAKDGKILRMPFEDAVTSRTRSKASLVSSPPPRPPSPDNSKITRTDDGDEFVAWMNPVTQVNCMVNKRTGMTMPAKKEIGTQRLSRKPSLTIQPKGSNEWIEGILQNWQNPVFTTAEPAIPQIALEGPDQHSQSILHGRHHHCSQSDIDRAFKESSAGVSGRISKTVLKNAEVIAQVDRKFILVSVQATSRHNDSSILLLVDQHAADERIRIEALMEALCSPPGDSNLVGNCPVLTTLLSKPLIFEISPREIQILKEQSSLFHNWGIIYEVNSAISDINNTTTTYRLLIQALPPGIIERCKQEPRLLIDLIRTEAWKSHESGKSIPSISTNQPWLQRIQHCPQGLLDMLNSRACRGAIMFNDELSKAQCETLVRKLADCKFPFQCAHGRPSLVPLVDTGLLKGGGTDLWDEYGDSSFGTAFRRWKQKQTPA